MSAARQLEHQGPHLLDEHAQEQVATEYATKGARRSTRENLRLVAPMRVQKASRGLFVIVLLGILGLGLIAMLLINTTLAQGAFTLSELRSEQAQLARVEATLTEEVAALATPIALEERARSLGMVASTTPAFIQIPTGKVLGKPKAAPGVRAPVTPADATVGEGVDDPAVAGIPEAPGEGYDPATADAMANEKAQEAATGGKKAQEGEAGVWSEPEVIGAEVISPDAMLDAVPVP